jgi:hypothetical protein
MGRPSKLTEVQKAEARKRRAQGATLAELAQLRCGKEYDFATGGMSRRAASTEQRGTLVMGAKAAITALRAFARSDPIASDRETLEALEKEVFNTSDRVTAVMLGASVETALEKLLATTLPPSSTPVGFRVASYHINDWLLSRRTHFTEGKRERYA